MTKALPFKLFISLIIYSLYTLLLTISCSSEKKDNQSGTAKPISSHPRKDTKKFFKNSTNWQKPGADYKWIPIWISDSKLLVPRASPAVIAANGYIYAIGGAYGSGKNKAIYSSVEFAKIQRDGSLGPWKQTSAMNTKRNFLAALSVNGYIYVIGGEKGYAGTDDLLSSVERAKILPDGSLGLWKLEPNTMNTSRRALVASYYNGWIYAFGGYNGIFLRDIERTQINSDGSLRKWIHEAEESKSQRYVHSGIIFKNFVYLFGGHVMSLERGTDTAEWATINSKGEINPWRNLSPMPTKRFGGDAVTLDDVVYVIGGQNTIPLSAVDKASILPDGNLTEWSKDTPLPSSRVGVALTAWNNVVYAIGGYSGEKYLREALRAYSVPGRTLGAWVNNPDLIASAAEADKMMPKDADNHFLLGIKKYKEKKYEEAIIELQLGIKVKEGLAQPHNLLGLIYHTKKMYPEAVNQYKTAIQLKPTFAPAYFNLGNVYFEMERIKKSEEMYRESVRLAPGFIDAKVKLLQLLAETDRCAEAKPKLQLLAEENPKNKSIQSLKKRCETQSILLLK